MSDTIKLTQGHTTQVSAEDFTYLAGYRWCAKWNKCTRSFYAVRMSPQINGKRTMIRMHRAIMGLEYGDKLQVDHINGDTLDNRRENLRIATASENQRNRAAQKNNTSGYKGASWDRRDGKWIARIKVNRKLIHLGYHSTREAAHAAYCEAARKYRGEFARTA